LENFDAFELSQVNHVLCASDLTRRMTAQGQDKVADLPKQFNAGN
jgi:hypothetical protein